MILVKKFVSGESNHRLFIPIKNPGTTGTTSPVDQQGRIQDFFQEGVDSFFWQNTSCIRKPQVISEYNEHTTVKDLQRRAKTGRHKRNANGCSRKECVTKRLWFILQVFCRIDKKKEHREKICNEWLFQNLKTVAP